MNKPTTTQNEVDEIDQAVFEFDHPDFLKHHKDNQQFMIDNFNKPITESEFVEHYTKLPRVINGVRIRKASKKRSPSRSRSQYKRLVERYGAFQGGHYV